ncbi:MAG TPA: hypothetical protein VGG92_09075 [Caulobacteraceae bacterium]
MATISVRSNIKELSRGLHGLAREQIPFATALMLTDLASKVAKGETQGMESTFDRPTPFTLKGMGVKAAKKSDLTASVFVKDAQARYLEPYLKPGGGVQVLGKNRVILMPIDVARNQYGNIPRGQLRQLKGRSDIFIGSVKTKSGEIYGVWQRPTRPDVGRHGRKGRAVNTSGHLQLLVRFTAPAQVGHNLGYEGRAQKVIDDQAAKSWDAAITKALATAR